MWIEKRKGLVPKSLNKPLLFRNQICVINVSCQVKRYFLIGDLSETKTVDVQIYGYVHAIFLLLSAHPVKHPPQIGTRPKSPKKN